MSKFPESRRYSVRDPSTGLVHQAMAYDEGYMDPVTTHTTWCTLYVASEWQLDDDAPLSCFDCLSQATTHFRVVQKVGLAIANTRAMSKISFQTDEP